MAEPILNPTAASLLGFLLGGPRSGWELERDVEHSIGNFWNVTRSQIYRELRSLDQQGLAMPGEAGPRERRPYAITEAGRHAFQEWIGRAPGEEIIRFPLLLTVFFAEHVEPAKLRRYLRQQELIHLDRLDGYERMAAEMGSEESGPAQALRFGIEYERAVLRWFASLPGYEPVGGLANDSASANC
jgi:DNA-binding PadR family transcriptional regulator